MQWLEKALSEPPEPNLHIMNKRNRGASPIYHLRDFWAVNIYGGTGYLILEDTGQKLPFKKGSICLLPPGCRRRFIFKEKCWQYVSLFSFSADCVTEKQTPEIFPAGNNLSKLSYSFSLLLKYSESGQRTRELSEFWQLLWTIHDITSSYQTQGEHPAMQKALKHINRLPGRELEITGVIKSSGISHNHLNRLFNKAYGCSVKKFISLRILKNAQYLLSSTDMPVKIIAINSGFSDLQAFNKFFRKYSGVSPRKYRTTHIAP